MDRNCCVRSLIFRIARREASFLVRWHRSTLPLVPAGRLRACGRCATGRIFEQPIGVSDGQGGVHRLRRIDDVVAMWDVNRARDAAWTNAQALWALGEETPLASDYLLALDRMVGFASRGLLIPADSWLLRVGRALSLGNLERRA